jgi:hypothetical protein
VANNGANVIYNRIVRPLFIKHQVHVDNLLGRATDAATNLVNKGMYYGLLVTFINSTNIWWLVSNIFSCWGSPKEQLKKKAFPFKKSIDAHHLQILTQQSLMLCPLLLCKCIKNERCDSKITNFNNGGCSKISFWMFFSPSLSSCILRKKKLNSNCIKYYKAKSLYTL